MSHTLPLFQELEAPAPQQGEAGVGPRQANAEGAPRGDRHLRAAWRLSRAMWRYPEHSPEQTRAGLAICRHLQALLAEAEQADR